MRHLNRKPVLIAVGLLSAMLLGAALATIMWQMTGTHQMKLMYAYGLKIEFLFDDVWTEVDEGYGYDWGEFLEGETKNVSVRVTNVGNTKAYTAWNGENFENGNWTEYTPSEWTRWMLTAKSVSGASEWPQSTTSAFMQLDPGLDMTVVFHMTEVEAVASTTYSFGLTIESHDGPL